MWGIPDLVKREPACEDLWLGFDITEVDIEDAPSLMQLYNHVQGHMNECEGCRSQDVGVELLELINTWEPLVRQWSWHWWHASVLNAEYRAMLEKPEAGTLHVCMDWQEPCLHFHVKTQ